MRGSPQATDTAASDTAAIDTGDTKRVQRDDGVTGTVITDGTVPADSDRGADADRGALYRGFGETLSRAFELALTPAIFGGLGLVLDRWLGLSPLFTIVLFVLAVGGTSMRMWYGYDARMKDLESSAPWARSGRDA